VTNVKLGTDGKVYVVDLKGTSPRPGSMYGSGSAPKTVSFPLMAPAPLMMPLPMALNRRRRPPGLQGDAEIASNPRSVRSLGG